MSKPAGARRSVPLYRNPRARAIFFQITAIIFLLWFAYTVAVNTAANMADRGIIVSINFLWQVAPFNIGYTPFWDYQVGESKYWEVLVIGIQNTLFVSACSIVSATILGFVIGVMRLSPNWLIARLASWYVECFRNIPLPLWIFFWYFAVFLPILPPPRESFDFGGGVYLNKEGLYTPRPLVDDPVGVTAFVILLVLLVVGLVLFYRRAKRLQDETGQRLPVFWLSLAALIVVPVAGFYLCGAPFHLEYPELGTFIFIGGFNLNFSFFIMWFALTTYTAAYIGENVRGGIIAVASGQSEAANSLGLRRTSTLRLVVIPQAMRVIIPPTISQYLNLTKNSSLAPIVAYEEIVSIFAGISLNQTGQALPIISMTIAFYATVSLLTSAILNWYNKKVQLTER